LTEEKVTIMVVDDEPGVLESFKLILGIKDYEVVAFPDGPIAIKSIEKGKFDIAFVDLHLPMGEPGVDIAGGIKVLKEIKKVDPMIEVVIVTGYAEERTKADAITLGALEYLSKPFLMEEIYELVERGLHKRRSRSRKKENPPPPPQAGIH
jgi:DNA-binding NtrC family response regulator